ncbi:helix-turn-helix transcriptional regulator [Actinoplanes aureus]|uniref:WYL domain-containing protein n=1 Tax=Actinoplanes aureus TaxID=2792083 RepID=A0A931FXW2_9ACTN|nr:WYL domain-containing protein [Actinoplanes aureus]MBG0563968.1 WYL domain-containing protein [Actinoplanes aureus]
MRASRLLSLLLLLQDRGRLTAQQIAEELDVSVRTVYRDVEALSEAGVPVYAELGAGGGYQLLDGYRTRLTGLTPQEAGSIFLAGVPDAAAELGLGAVLTTAELKLRAALPARLNRHVGEVRDRFHLDAAGWFRETETHPHLSALAGAVWNRRRCQMRYRRWRAPHEVDRVVEPLGIVLKAGVWYFVARVDGDLRTYRVATILDLEVLDETFDRPADFDLARTWAEWAADFERRLHRDVATVRLAPAALDRVPYLMNRAMARNVRDAPNPPDADGWTTITLPIESVRHAHAEFLRLGEDVEVLEPAELREMMRASVTAMARLYSLTGIFS